MRSDACNDMQIEHISFEKIQRLCYLNVQRHVLHFQITIYAGKHPHFIWHSMVWHKRDSFHLCSPYFARTLTFSFGTKNDFRLTCNAYDSIFSKKFSWFSRRHSLRNCNSSNTSSNRYEIKFLQRLTPVVKICFQSILFCMFPLISMFSSVLRWPSVLLLFASWFVMLTRAFVGVTTKL